MPNLDKTEQTTESRFEELRKRSRSFQSGEHDGTPDFPGTVRLLVRTIYGVFVILTSVTEGQLQNMT